VLVLVVAGVLAVAAVGWWLWPSGEESFPVAELALDEEGILEVPVEELPAHVQEEPDHTGSPDPSDLATDTGRWQLDDDPSDAGDDLPVVDQDPHEAIAAGDSTSSQASRPGRGATAERSTASSGPPKAEDGGRPVHQGTLGRNTTLSQRLGEYGLDAAQINEIVQALRGHFDFRRSQPTDKFTLVRGEGGEVARFRYEVGPAEIYEARRRGQELSGRKVPVRVTSRRRGVGGQIALGLAAALAAAKLPGSVFRAFQNTLGRDIDFRTAQRRGDLFKAIVDEEFVAGKRVGLGSVWALEYQGQTTGRQRAFFYKDASGEGRYYDRRGRTFERSRFLTPVRNARISSRFNLRRLHPVLKRRVAHLGVDYAAPRGTPVRATLAGKVTYVGRKGASGNLVILRHEGGLESIYAHLSRFRRGLKRRQAVEQGYVIGYVGSTGRSTGPHLHFGLREKGRFIDPLKQSRVPGRPIAQKYRAKFLRHARRLARQLDAVRL
jgi:murein DD-endopeptidase MepM/ murein hydrolase activator NlpD